MSDFVLIPSVSKMTELGTTVAQVYQYPELHKLCNRLGYLTADACRKAVVGVDGTNIQMLEAISQNEELIMEQVCLFFVKNRIKPVLRDLELVASLMVETAERLSRGDMLAVNRRHELTNNRVLKPKGDDIVPDALRDSWVVE